jgi:M6 family metalloprotease-like protein
MKRIFTLFLFVFIMMFFTGCDAFSVTDVSGTETTEINYDDLTTDEPTTEEPTTEEPTTEEPTTDEPTTDEPTTEESTTEEPTTEEPTTEEITTEPVTYINNSFIPEGYSLLQDELDAFGIPSMGDVNILVFAVDFPDSKYTNENPSILDIETAFNGESNDLDFESVRSYYQISSYNQLNINADVYGYYTLSENASYYETENEKYIAIDPVTGEYVYDDSEVTHVESDIIFELLTYYDDQIDYNDYDSNNDGLIDGIYIVYNYPSDSENDLWWAYQYNYSYTDSFDGVSPDYYMWASNDFLNEGIDDINARTFIHETGHMMGLDDYYDYSYEDDYNNGGLGSYMMDYNVGDHDPFSKILMGWIKPIVIESSTTINILPHLESGDVLLITDEWNGTIFDEYLLVSYYTPDGLNSYDPDYIFTESGISIFHVSARIDDGYLVDSYYYSIFNNNNTDTPNKLIDIVEADMNESIEQYEIIENSDLFQEGDVLGVDIYLDYKWYDNTYIDFTVSIDSITNEKATITVTYK